MLILNRRTNESIEIPGSNITVTVLRISRGRVQLGITAPKEVAIFRQELLDGVERQQPAQSSTPLTSPRCWPR
jgi:carbon storage regulator